MSHPFFGTEFTFNQPDGTQLKVRGWGDQSHAIFETLDGFTVVQDPVTGFYNYATTTRARDEFRSFGVRAGHADPAALKLTAGLRLDPSATRVLAQTGSSLLKPRWQERHDAAKAALRLSTAGVGIAAAPPARQTVGSYVGLCLLIQFPDVSGAVPQSEVQSFCSLTGYNGFGNHGSVYDYYLDNSSGKLKYTSVVAPYYTAANPRSYYTNPAIPFGQRTRDLIAEALQYHLSQGLDFTSLAVDSQNAVYATNVFYAGDLVNNWSEGLWPHSSRLVSPYPVGAGRNIVDYQITNMGATLALGTYCHENGHMLCDFPDLYEYANQNAGVGDYCLMCLGGNRSPLNPIQICAYLKFRAGWANPLAVLSNGDQVAAASGRNQFFIHRKNTTEYFLIENRHQVGRDLDLSDSGLAVWHVDEVGSNSEPDKAPPGHQRFECSLVQADGRDDLGLGANPGDATDLFRKELNARLADGTQPSTHWWDGTSSNLDLHNIGSDGQVITFEVSLGNIS